MLLNVVTREEFSELKGMLKEILERLPVNNGNGKEVITAKELKELLQCSDSTLGNYRKSGMLPFKKVGGRFYYPKNGVNDLLTSNTVNYEK